MKCVKCIDCKHDGNGSVLKCGAGNLRLATEDLDCEQFARKEEGKPSKKEEMDWLAEQKKENPLENGKCTICHFENSDYSCDNHNLFKVENDSFGRVNFCGGFKGKHHSKDIAALKSIITDCKERVKDNNDIVKYCAKSIKLLEERGGQK